MFEKRKTKKPDFFREEFFLRKAKKNLENTVIFNKKTKYELNSQMLTKT